DRLIAAVPAGGRWDGAWRPGGVLVGLSRRPAWLIGRLGLLRRSPVAVGRGLGPARRHRVTTPRPHHVSGKRGGLVFAGRIVRDEEAGETGTAPAVGQSPRRFVAGRTVIGEDFRRRLALVEMGVGQRHGRQDSHEQTDGRRDTPKHSGLLRFCRRTHYL